MKTSLLFFGLVICLVLTGCGNSKQKVEEQARIQSFTNNLQKANVDYNISFISTSLIIQNVPNGVRSLPTSTLLALTQSDGPFDQVAIKYYLQKCVNDWDGCITNGQNAIEAIGNGETDFEYIYTNHKELSSSFKDDFYNMKDLISKNLVFIQTLEQGEMESDTVQEWMDNNNKINEAYKSILLEVERLQKP